MSYQYDREFFDFVNASAGRSARRFIETFEATVLDHRPASVIDVGCGRGVWAAEWKRRGVTDVLGVDGAYVSPETLLIPRECFRAVDLSKPVYIGSRFDLVQCLEVAEHVPAESAGTLVETLVRHGDVVLFSAAVPGQGGEFHVNERPYAYWRDLFASHGYYVFDAIRPHVLADAEIEPWYRYNAFVFANDAGARRLSPATQRTRIPVEANVPNLAPWSWRARCYAISLLPVSLATTAARLKHRFANRVRG